MEVTLNIFNSGLKKINIAQNVFIANASIILCEKYFIYFKI